MHIYTAINEGYTSTRGERGGREEGERRERGGREEGEKREERRREKGTRATRACTMHTAINEGYTSTRGERGGREEGREEGERRERGGSYDLPEESLHKTCVECTPWPRYLVQWS